MSVSAAMGEGSTFREFLDAHLDQEMLRFTTAGSVDDGKSTLIGRLLHDTKSVYEDQLALIKASKVNRASGGGMDLSLLTDGLKAEREQGITIDVAYRYFSTTKRKFIIADTPGHEQYTRNMATGASTADVAIVLIDARAFVKAGGLLPQSRRHTYIASLLRIPHVVAAVNKMDLVEYSAEVFEKIRSEFGALAARLGLLSTEVIPVSALAGDNVVERSVAMPWYEGPTLLEYLEAAPLAVGEAADGPLRFPVQLVVRPNAEFRGFAGRVERGEVRPGLRVKALPSGVVTRVKSIVTYDGELKAASFPRSVTVELEDEIDLSRGEMLIAEEEVAPTVSTAFRAMVVWMHEQPLVAGKTYLAKHTTRTVRATVRAIRYRVDVNSVDVQGADHVAAGELAMNDIAEVEFDASLPLFFDPYSESREMGALILIDAVSNATVGAGMIVGDLQVAAVDAGGVFASYVPYARSLELLEPSSFDAKSAAARLEQRVAEAAAYLEGLSDAAAAGVPAAGKWSVQQTIGHLCDSAMNNQQRMVRLQMEPSLEFPGYEQDGWVRVQRYDLVAWPEVMALWVALNRHMVHTIRHMDSAALGHVWRFEGQELTLAFLVEDYLAHLEHHLRALGVVVA